MKKRKKKIVVAMPRCSYCDEIPVQEIYVCEAHLKALDRVASRRKKE